MNEWTSENTGPGMLDFQEPAVLGVCWVILFRYSWKEFSQNLVGVGDSQVLATKCEDLNIGK